jgi:NADPH:quinone reductase-like Zn-dependent oxidoreductase
MVPTHYKSVIVSRFGGPEVLQVVENELHPPAPGEVRIRVLASSVCQPDTTVRAGNRCTAERLWAETALRSGYSVVVK